MASVEAPEEIGRGRTGVHRFHQVMDVAGLLSLAWAAALTWIAGGLLQRDLRPDPELPFYVEPAGGVAGLSERGVAAVVLTVLALPLAGLVVATFGRAGAPLRARRWVAAPFSLGVAVALILHTVQAFSADKGYSNYIGTASGAFGWDAGILVLLALAVVLLAFREPRITAGVQAIAASSVVLTVVSFLLYAGLTLHDVVENSFTITDLGSGPLTWALVISPVAVAVVMGWAGVVLVWGLVRSRRWAVIGIVVWGTAVWGLAVLPSALLVQALELPVAGVTLGWVQVWVTGLDWLVYSVAIGAAVLIPALYRMYRAGDAAARRRYVARASGFAGLLLLMLLLFQMVNFYWLMVPLRGVWLGADVLVLALALAGTVLLLLAARQPERRDLATRLTMAAVLICAPQFMYLLAALVAPTPTVEPDDLLYGSPLQVFTPVLNVWDGYRVMLTVVLPLALSMVAHRAQRGSRAPTETETEMA